MPPHALGPGDAHDPAQRERHDDRVVEHPDHRQEVRHEVDRRRQVGDERDQRELAAPPAPRGRRAGRARAPGSPARAARARAPRARGRRARGRRRTARRGRSRPARPRAAASPRRGTVAAPRPSAVSRLRRTMTALADLELPSFDYLDPELRGERFHQRDGRARRAGLAGDDAARLRGRRPRGRRVLPAQSKSFTFPGMKIAEIFGIDDGPLCEEIRRNILHINGADHRRLRGLVNPFFTPRAVEKLAPAHARLPRGALRRPRRRDAAATRSRRSASPTPRR